MAFQQIICCESQQVLTLQTKALYRSRDVPA
jgi:hypothetical protein